MLPATPNRTHPQHWLHNRDEGPRRLAIGADGIDGSSVQVILEEWEPGELPDSDERLQPFPTLDTALFLVEGPDPSALINGLQRLRQLVDARPECRLTGLARHWFRESPPAAEQPRAVALVARDCEELVQQLDLVRQCLARDPEQAIPATSNGRDRIFYSPHPLGRDGQLAFVFPGSGNHFPGMGRDLALWRPGVLWRQNAQNRRLRSQYLPEKFWDEYCIADARHHEKLYAQVALSSLVSDVLHGFGVKPDAAIGYSLGESASLVALHAWTDRDALLQAMQESTLFSSDMVGPCEAARKAWQLTPGQPVEWVAGIVDRPADGIRRVCASIPRTYLLIINAPSECVVGGERSAVVELVRRLGCSFLPLTDPATVHCPLVNEVAQAYRHLHLLPTTPPAGVRFYSTAWGRAYEVTRERAAEAILAQAINTVNFPAVIEAAYRDGVRFFLEVGPGASCTRLIDVILGEQPHRSCSACVPGVSGPEMVLRVLAQLAAERFPVDLRSLFAHKEQATPQRGARVFLVPIGGQPFDVPRVHVQTAPVPNGQPLAEPAVEDLTPVIALSATAQHAQGEAHGAYLRYAEEVNLALANNLAFQSVLL